MGHTKRLTLTFALFVSTLAGAQQPPTAVYGLTSGTSAMPITAGAASLWKTTAGALTVDGKAGLNLQSNDATTLALSSTTGSSLFSPVATTGTPPVDWNIANAAHTLLTARTEYLSNVVDNGAGGTVTLQWVGSTTANSQNFNLQRYTHVRAPTLAFSSTQTQTINQASSFSVSGGPIAGTNAAISEAYALWVRAGIGRFDGTIEMIHNVLIDKATTGASLTSSIGNTVRSAGTVTVTTTGNNLLSAGETFYLTPGEAEFPPGMKTVASTPGAAILTYTEAGNDATSGVTQTLVRGYALLLEGNPTANASTAGPAVRIGPTKTTSFGQVAIFDNPINTALLSVSSSGQLNGAGATVALLNSTSDGLFTVSGAAALRTGAVTRLLQQTSATTLSLGASASGVPIAFQIQLPANTGVTANNNFVDFYIKTNTATLADPGGNFTGNFMSDIVEARTLAIATTSRKFNQKVATWQFTGAPIAGNNANYDAAGSLITALWIDNATQISAGNVTTSTSLYITGGPTAAGTTTNGPYGAFFDGSDIRVDKHVVCRSTAPGIAAGTGAGTGPTISLSGCDMAGLISVTTGTGPAASATVVTITFNETWINSLAPKTIVLTPAEANSAALTGNAQVYIDNASTSTTTFVIKVGSTNLTASTAYKWYYMIYG